PPPGGGGAAHAAVRAAVAAEHRGGAGAAFLDALAARVAVGVAAVAAVYDPGCLVLGGEIGHAGGTVLASRAEASLATLSPVRTRILPTALGREAIVRGGLRTTCDAAQAELFAPAG
ncbi:ROK family transcriptional regulator, partial [Streptomyces sp. NPDC058459]